MVGFKKFGTEFGDSSLYGHGRVSDLVFHGNVAIAMPQREMQEKLGLLVEYATNGFFSVALNIFQKGARASRWGVLKSLYSRARRERLKRYLLATSNP